MGEDLKQRVQQHDDDEDDEELFDSDSLLSNSDDDGDHTEMNRNEPLYGLSSTLVEQLPIKRGLSKYYQGKSQSYTSLSVVRTLEDLPKKESPFKRKMMMKTCKSYGASQACGCRVMSRKAPRAASCAALAAQGGGGEKPPLVHPLRKNSCNSH
ncbi:uncharacterized protein LOC121987664 [Zingiber officinale]|uniref:Uncharacterized protein n=1 Tax=Zingiber officinale TaxID=94328 RepID=A0A8J5GQL4_ZINOF|nr:uncharacterized protein LOC121987664 [Zingiber officinale]KAG6504212.1 hypothetical protein ZIOFF_036543 [Zingiber officinale]